MVVTGILYLKGQKSLLKKVTFEQGHGGREERGVLRGSTTEVQQSVP